MNSRRQWLLLFAVLGSLGSLSCARQTDVEVRPFPYPYRAAIALASDIDDTDSVAEFITLQSYLAGNGPTPLGTGLGLEVGNSFWFYDSRGKSRFTYFQDLRGTPSPAAAVIEEFIAAGYLDVLHSYGEFRAGGFDRPLAERAVRVLKEIQAREGVTVRIWSHHGDSLNTDNLGRLPMQRGDNPGAPEYHADLLLNYGMKFLDQWDVTHVVGQDAWLTPLDYLKEGGTMLSWARNRLSGVDEQAFVRGNNLLRPLVLDDGHTMYAYRRFINSWGGGSPDITGLAGQLSGGHLSELIRKGGSMVVYTHFGSNERMPVDSSGVVPLNDLIPEGTRKALAALARRREAGELMVTTTARLLTYVHTRHHLLWTTRSDGSETTIEIGRLEDAVEGSHEPRPEELMGVTFYVPSAARTRVLVGGREPLVIVRNPPDETGRESVSFPWRPLRFPDGFTEERWLAAKGKPGGRGRRA